jgi:hypothetical protein
MIRVNLISVALRPPAFAETWAIVLRLPRPFFFVNGLAAALPGRFREAVLKTVEPQGPGDVGTVNKRLCGR